MNEARSVTNTLFASTSDWVEFLVRDHFYPEDQLVPGVDFLAVYRDAAHRQPLILVHSGSDGASERAFQVAREQGFPIVVTGEPESFAAAKVGLFDNDSMSLPRFPSWVPRRPRGSTVPRSVMLLPFESEHHLRSSFVACHNVIYKALANDPATTFDLLLLVITAKIRDEQLGHGDYEILDDC